MEEYRLLSRQRPCMNSKRRRKVTTILLRRDGNHCHYCNVAMVPTTEKRNNRTVTREHVVPLSYGGPSAQDNLVLCCNSCNNLRGNTLRYCECHFCTLAYSKYLGE
jgi:5-methylcytosine-specific restriction endonuclease McrA